MSARQEFNSKYGTADADSKKALAHDCEKVVVSPKQEAKTSDIEQRQDEFCSETQVPEQPHERDQEQRQEADDQRPNKHRLRLRRAARNCKRFSKKAVPTRQPPLP
ncbi:MAG: hypothetical protein L0Y72_32320 [Gemmataceae bacterium]|nr:hypothetical protein [Gemmataceae bacterium]MCI0743741.1 hypothetical protein [Gemmataceae bacterium]